MNVAHLALHMTCHMTCTGFEGVLDQAELYADHIHFVRAKERLAALLDCSVCRRLINQYNQHRDSDAGLR